MFRSYDSFFILLTLALLTVGKVNQLRRPLLMSKGIEMKVVKNTLAAQGHGVF
jgi:ribosomal protein L10